MFRAALLLFIALQTSVASAAEPASAAGPTKRLFVLKLDAAQEVDPALVSVVTDLVVTHIQRTGSYKVTSANELVDILSVEQQKQLTGCSDQSCVGEIAGALGAEMVVGGNLSLLGGRRVLTLRLIDTREARLANQLTRDLPDDSDGLRDVIRGAAFELVGVVEATPWYATPWVLGAIGAGVVALGVAGYVLLRPEAAPEGALGTVVLDAN